jgi:hypothetical protein
MSTPDALPTEIALIALLLFEFWAYSTSLHHYYHRPITLSTFQLLQQPTIHHMASINILQLLLKKFFCPQDWCLTHIVQPHTTSATQSSITTTSFDFCQFPQSLFSLQLHASRVMGPTYGSIAAIINHYEAALGVIAVTFITGSTLDSIDWTSTATTATHAIRHCYTSSTQNACNWCDLVIFLV